VAAGNCCADIGALHAGASFSSPDRQPRLRLKRRSVRSPSLCARAVHVGRPERHSFEQAIDRHPGDVSRDTSAACREVRVFVDYLLTVWRHPPCWVCLVQNRAYMAAPHRDYPPPYIGRAELAGELSISEASVDEMVHRGVLPNPVKQSSRGPRWSWKAVEVALALGPSRCTMNRTE
jgi:hypothetical protein